MALVAFACAGCVDAHATTTTLRTAGMALRADRASTIIESAAGRVVLGETRVGSGTCGAAESTAIAITRDCGAARETITRTFAGYELTWTFDARPSGDVRIRVPIDGALGGAVRGRGVEYPIARGLLSIGAASLVDARGDTTPLAMHVGSDLALEIVVPSSLLASASYPVVIDPLITTDYEIDDRVAEPPTSQPNPSDIACSTDFCVAVTLITDDGNATLVAQLLDPSGTPMGPLLELPVSSVPAAGRAFAAIEGSTALVTDGVQRAVIRSDSTTAVPWDFWPAVLITNPPPPYVPAAMGTGAGSFVVGYTLVRATDLMVLDQAVGRVFACNAGVCLVQGGGSYLSRYRVDTGQFVLVDHPDLGTTADVLAASASAVDGFDVLLDDGGPSIARLPTASTSLIVDGSFLHVLAPGATELVRVGTEVWATDAFATTEIVHTDLATGTTTTLDLTTDRERLAIGRTRSNVIVIGRATTTADNAFLTILTPGAATLQNVDWIQVLRPGGVGWIDDDGDDYVVGYGSYVRTLGPDLTRRGVILWDPAPTALVAGRRLFADHLYSLPDMTALSPSADPILASDHDHFLTSRGFVDPNTFALVSPLGPPPTHGGPSSGRGAVLSGTRDPQIDTTSCATLRSGWIVVRPSPIPGTLVWPELASIDSPGTFTDTLLDRQPPVSTSCAPPACTSTLLMDSNAQLDRLAPGVWIAAAASDFDPMTHVASTLLLDRFVDAQPIERTIAMGPYTLGALACRFSNTCALTYARAVGYPDFNQRAMLRLFSFLAAGEACSDDFDCIRGSCTSGVCVDPPPVDAGTDASALDAGVDASVIADAWARDATARDASAIDAASGSSPSCGCRATTRGTNGGLLVLVLLLALAGRITPSRARGGAPRPRPRRARRTRRPRRCARRSRPRR
jgi:hypothetical protein